MARRTPYHYGQFPPTEPVPGPSEIGTQVDDMFEMETENDQLVNGLRTKVSALKSLTLDMGDEIKSQNLFLKSMDNEFDSTWGLLSSSMARVKKLALSGHNRIYLYLALFSLFVFFFVYIIIRFR